MVILSQLAKCTLAGKKYETKIKLETKPQPKQTERSLGAMLTGETMIHSETVFTVI
jgi:hypothetical protein